MKITIELKNDKIAYGYDGPASNHHTDLPIMPYHLIFIGELLNQIGKLWDKDRQKGDKCGDILLKEVQ